MSLREVLRTWKLLHKKHGHKITNQFNWKPLPGVKESRNHCLILPVWEQGNRAGPSTETFRVFPFFGLVFFLHAFSAVTMVPVFARRSSSKISSWHLRPGWQERDPGAFFLGCQRWRLKSDIFLGNGVHVLLKEGNGDDETQKSLLKEAFKDFMTFQKLKSTLFSRWRSIYLSGWISFRWFDAFRDFGNPNPNLTCLEVKG